MNYLTEKMFREEADRCESCLEQPCRNACPAGCCPTEFLHAARGLAPSDFQRAGAMILSQNPIGGICGTICSEKHCMAACSRGKVGKPVNIPALQAYIIGKAREYGLEDAFTCPETVSGDPVAVLGAGPAGLSAAAVLAQAGRAVDLYEAADVAGGMCGFIPKSRLPADVLEKDALFIEKLGVRFHLGQSVASAEELLKSYSQVVDASGRHQKITLPIEGNQFSMDALEYLKQPPEAKRVAIIGCGGIAVDCAMLAMERGATQVELFALEQLCEVKLGEKEQLFLFQKGIGMHTRTSITKIAELPQGAYQLTVQDMILPQECAFHPASMRPAEGSQRETGPFDCVILAIGTRAYPAEENSRIFRAGECALGPATAVDAVASGKRAALELLGQQGEKLEQKPLDGYCPVPVSLETEVFGVRVRSPFFVSASPPSDGYEQMKAAYEAGWAGGILKTGFDGVPIHTPGEYMHSTDRLSYANCDGVSARALDTLCEDIKRLRAEFPDRMTMASTGADLTGDDECDRRNWRICTQKLERAGAMGIEYSMSCPGSDGPDGLAVNQDAKKTTKIVRWILEDGDPNVPKLFKLTASAPNVGVITQTLAKLALEFPTSKFGITIGDTIPILVFQNRGKEQWEDGVVMGMGGKGIVGINAYAISKSVGHGIPVSASGGVMSYRDAANYLAMGAEFVQCCSFIMRYGYHAVRELESGLSWLMKSRNISSVAQLRSACGESIILPYESISAKKKIPTVNRSACTTCGNCRRCPAQAVSADEQGYPVFDATKCVGCSFCNHLCFTGALSMRERTPEEL